MAIGRRGMAVWALWGLFLLTGHVQGVLDQAAATALRSILCSGSWEVQRSANIGADAAQLSAVSGTSSSDVWAVGTDITANRGLIEHWDGSRWRKVPSPKAGDFSGFTGVSALGPSDVWAVGGYSSGGAGKTLAERWDGAKWAVVSTPNIGLSNTLTSVSAVSQTDVWAVGYRTDGQNHTHTLAEHWDGSKWNIVATPDASTEMNQLLGVFAASSNQAWAVGFTSLGGQIEALVEYWDGLSWTIATNPSPGTLSFLLGVSGSSGADVWAVGNSFDSSTGTTTLIEHWDGSAWTIVASPNVGTGTNVLQAVSSVSAAEAWAVGYYADASNTPRTLTQQWDGTAWSLVTSPNIGAGLNTLQGAWAESAADAYAVGHVTTADNKDRPLIERFC